MHKSMEASNYGQVSLFLSSIAAHICSHLDICHGGERVTKSAGVALRSQPVKYIPRVYGAFIFRFGAKNPSARTIIPGPHNSKTVCTDPDVRKGAKFASAVPRNPRILCTRAIVEEYIPPDSADDGGYCVPVP